MGLLGLTVNPMVLAFLVYFVNLWAGPLPQLTEQVVWLLTLLTSKASFAAPFADHHPGPDIFSWLSQFGLSKLWLMLHH